MILKYLLDARFFQGTAYIPVARRHRLIPRERYVRGLGDSIY